VKTGPVRITLAGVSIDFVDASSVSVAWLLVQQAFVNVNLAVGSRKSGVAVAHVFGNQILTIAVNARIVGAVVNVRLTMSSRESKGTATFVRIDSINTLSSIFARINGAIVDVYLTVKASESDGAGASVLVNAVSAGSTIETRS
jgi:hypothetical protein